MAGPATVRDPQVVAHLRAIARAGTDTAKYIAALQDVRYDTTLSQSQRQAIHVALAQDAVLGYRFCVTGRVPDPAEIERWRAAAQSKAQAAEAAAQPPTKK